MTEQVDQFFWDQPEKLDNEPWQDYAARLQRFREQYVKPIKGEHYIDYLIRWKQFVVEQKRKILDQKREELKQKREELDQKREENRRLAKTKRKTKIHIKIKSIAPTNLQS